MAAWTEKPRAVLELDEVDHVWGGLFRAIPPVAWEQLTGAHRRALTLVGEAHEALEGAAPRPENGSSRAEHIAAVAGALRAAADELESMAKALGSVDEQYDRIGLDAGTLKTTAGFVR